MRNAFLGDAKTGIAEIGFNNHRKAYWEVKRRVIRINQKQIEIYPEYWQSYHAIGYACLQLNKPEEALLYFDKALAHDAEINESIADDIMQAYLDLNDLPGFETWIDNTMRAKKNSHEELDVLHKIAGKFNDLQKDSNPY